MSVPACLWFLHEWRRLWHGAPRIAINENLAARECVHCDRFDVYAFGSYHKADRRAFDNIRPQAPEVGR